MSMIEKQAKLGRELLELNVDTVRKFAELSSENFRKYMELNQNYAEKLPEIREVSAFVELQRDYGQSLWEGVREDFAERLEPTGSRGGEAHRVEARSLELAEALLGLLGLPMDQDDCGHDPDAAGDENSRWPARQVCDRRLRDTLAPT